MPTRAYHGRIGEIPQESRFGGTLLRTGVIMNQALLTFVSLKPGFTMSDGFLPDTHPEDQLVYMIRGQIEFVLNETDRYHLKANEVLYIPSNVSHIVNLLDDEGCEFIEVFAPIRTDYLSICGHQIDQGQPKRNPDGSRADPRSMEEYAAQERR